MIAKMCMMLFLVVASVAVFAASTGTQHARSGSFQEEAPLRPEEDNKCLECVCRAMGAGKCDLEGDDPAAQLWGPFRISQPYWIDAGRPVQPGDNEALPGAFERCVTEPFCAVRTVKGYMSGPLGLKDCDGDGKLTCKDLIVTHLYGRYECRNTRDPRVNMVEMCMNASPNLTVNS